MGFHRHKHPQANLWFGVFILAAGIFWLLDRMAIIFLPNWLFTWEFLLIGIGFLFGIKGRFRGVGWLIPIIIGTFFLLQDIPSLQDEVRLYGFPVLIIVIGFIITYRALTSRSRQAADVKENPSIKPSNFGADESIAQVSSDDMVAITNQFGSVKRKIISKNFKGGKITNSFGSVELDLSHADIDGVVTIYIDQTLAGFELVVPANWEVKSEVNLTLAGIEELRTNVVTSPTTKVLVLAGSCTLSGIEIKSYN